MLSEIIREWAYGDHLTGKWVYDETADGNYGTLGVAIPGDEEFSMGHGMDTTPCDNTCPYHADNLDNWWGNYLGGSWGSYRSLGDAPFIPGAPTPGPSCSDQGLYECWDGSCVESLNNCPEEPVERAGCMIEDDMMYDPEATVPCNSQTWPNVPHPVKNGMEFYTFECGNTSPYAGEFKCGGYVGHHGTSETQKIALDFPYASGGTNHTDTSLSAWCNVDKDWAAAGEDNCCCAGSMAHGYEAPSWWEDWSDIRLKENIELVGISYLGTNIYEFDYIDKSYGDGRYRGVMAQEVPWASIKGSNGYYMVDYSRVDVPFEKID
jgi:hypothetical protein